MNVWISGFLDAWELGFLIGSSIYRLMDDDVCPFIYP